jgi:hypothetical protein
MRLFYFNFSSHSIVVSCLMELFIDRLPMNLFSPSLNAAVTGLTAILEF